jgi:hypothetical protein
MKTKQTTTIEIVGKIGAKLIVALGLLVPVFTVAYCTTNVFADEKAKSCSENIYNGTYAINTTGDLNELSGYMAVTGDLIIKNTALRNLEGLECLSEIGGELVMVNNSLLENIDGLRNLTSVARIEISYNPVLMNLGGLRNIASVEDYLFITCNDALINMNGLSAITSVDNLFVNNNDALTNLKGLSNLVTVNQEFVVIGNDGLTNLDLISLKTVGGLSLYGNVILPPGQSREIIERLTGSIALSNVHNNYELTGVSSLKAEGYSEEVVNNKKSNTFFNKDDWEMLENW